MFWSDDPWRYSIPNFQSARRSDSICTRQENFIDEQLPWAGGNPQPKSGKRGSPSWNAAQMSRTSINDSAYHPQWVLFLAK